MANRVSELTTTIAENTAKVNAYLASHSIPDLSFDLDVPVQLQADVAYTGPRDAALQACSELQYLLAGPVLSIFTPNVSTAIILQSQTAQQVASRLLQTRY